MSLLDQAAKKSPFLESLPAEGIKVAPPATGLASSFPSKTAPRSGEILIEIRDFQAHKHIEFTIKGFVALHGESNLGKSSILRAMRALLGNEWPADYLRDGASESYISMTFSIEQSPNVESLHFWKSPKKNEYGVKLRGKPMLVYPKIGKDVPQEVKDMGFAPVTSEKGDNFFLNFNRQAAPWFLVSNTAMEKTSFFNSVFKIHKYEAANRSINSDAIQIHQKINLLTSQTQAKEIDLKNQSDLTAALKSEVEKEQELLRRATELEQKAKDAYQLSTLIRKEELALEETGAVLDIMKMNVHILQGMSTPLLRIKEIKTLRNDLAQLSTEVSQTRQRTQISLTVKDRAEAEAGKTEQVYKYAERRAEILRTQMALKDFQAPIASYAASLSVNQISLKKITAETDLATLMLSVAQKRSVLTSNLRELNTFIQSIPAQTEAVKEAQARQATEQQIGIVLQAQSQLTNSLFQHKGNRAHIENTKTSLQSSEAALKKCQDQMALAEIVRTSLDSYLTEAEAHLAICTHCGSKINAQHQHAPI